MTYWPETSIRIPLHPFPSSPTAGARGGTPTATQKLDPGHLDGFDGRISSKRETVLYTPLAVGHVGATGP